MRFLHIRNLKIFSLIWWFIIVSKYCIFLAFQALFAVVALLKIKVDLRQLEYLIVAVVYRCCTCRNHSGPTSYVCSLEQLKSGVLGTE